VHDEPTHGELERELALAENTMLHLLLDEPHPNPWSVHELALAHGDPPAAADAIAGLHATGLIHLAASFAWPTRAAVAAVRVENLI